MELGYTDREIGSEGQKNGKWFLCVPMTKGGDDIDEGYRVENPPVVAAPYESIGELERHTLPPRRWNHGPAKVHGCR